MNEQGAFEAYQGPTIVDYGDLQDLTAACLGGGNGDSGYPSTVGGFSVGPSNPAAGCTSSP